MTLRPVWVWQGQFFDIVKMEERETWTARFLRTEAGFSDLVEVKKTFDGCTFSIEKTIRFRADFDWC